MSLTKTFNQSCTLAEKIRQMKEDNIIGDIVALRTIMERYEKKVIDYSEFRRRARALAEDLIHDIEK